MFEMIKDIADQVKEQKTAGETAQGQGDIPDFAKKAGDSGKENSMGEQTFESADAPIFSENVAPLDSEQAAMIADTLKQIPELRPEVWQTLSPEQRVDTLNLAEQQIAGIERRQPPCTITTKQLGEGFLGYYQNGQIVLNESLVSDNSMESYKNTLDTLVHEGRHAYQDYNLHVELVHPNVPEVEAWKLNNDLGYETGESSIFDFKKTGFKHYLLQPVEVDARVFAENVLNDMNLY